MRASARSFAFVTFLGLTLAVSGCSDGDVTESPATSTTAVVTAASVVDEPAVSDATTDSTAEPDDSLDSQVRTALGIPGLALLTPMSGAGPRPELAWEPVDGAFFYNVVVLDPTGRGYWGWEGTDTSVHVGGEPVIKEGLSGPSVIDGMTWQVSAYDSDQNLIALSHQQPIAP